MATGLPQELPLATGDLESCWGPWAGRPALLQPQAACPYTALPCYGVLPPTPLALYAPPVSAAYALPGGPPLLWPRAAFCSPPGRPGTADDPPRAKAAASRESAAALKAWLGRHRKHPYPSKGEKVLLAVLSSMTLTQVSTWFANARRRLKKENRARWGARLPPAEGGAQEEEEGGEGEAEEGGGAEAASAPRLGTRPAGGAEQAGTRGGREPPPKPKIWCVAELAVGCRPGGAAL